MSPCGMTPFAGYIVNPQISLDYYCRKLLTMIMMIARMMMVMVIVFIIFQKFYSSQDILTHFLALLPAFVAGGLVVNAAKYPAIRHFFTHFFK